LTLRAGLSPCPGNAGAPEVVAAIDDAIRRITASGKAAGILVGGAEPGAHALALGATFVAVGHDVGLLRQGRLPCAQRWPAAPTDAQPPRRASQSPSRGRVAPPRP